jgi:hypothetical protein
MNFMIVPTPHRRLVFSSLSLLGLASLCYLFGAAVIFFDLPSASFLRRAFVGGAAWYEQEQTSSSTPEQQPTAAIGVVDKPDKTCDGFTLCLPSGGPRALLIDMHGKTVCSWEPPFSTIWPESVRHVPIGSVPESAVYFNDARIFPNGDLLALIEGPVSVHSPSNSYGLVKLHKDARVIWAYTAHCHHALDVGEDGTIYTLSYNFMVRDLPRGLKYIPTPCVIDSVEVISPEGKQIKRIPLLEAFKNSAYAPLLSSLEKPQLFSDLTPPNWSVSAVEEDKRRRDVFHTNAVKVLSRKLAPKFPLFRAGHLLISPRHLDAIAMLDPDSEKVVWAARGPWHAQHDPSFLDNGHLLLFDNLGSVKGSRVLEYDPHTQSFPWWYPDDNGPSFFTRIRGLTQRLPNGNTLIVSSESGEVFEVTPDRETVWSCSFGRASLSCARRYMPQQLPFLQKDQHAR